MSKLLLIAGLVLPFSFKGRATVAETFPSVANDDQPQAVTGATVSIGDTTVATDAPTVSATVSPDDPPWPELPELKSPDAAVAEVLAELVDYHGAGASIRFSHIASYYRQFGPHRAWPAIADKTFSQMLCALGCEREQRDLRATEGKRPTFIVLVPALAEDEEAVSAVPYRMAA